MSPLALLRSIKPEIPHWQTYEFWRERAIARMWCDLPINQKFDLFDPSRGIFKIEYMGWLDRVCLFLDEEVRSVRYF